MIAVISGESVWPHQYRGYAAVEVVDRDIENAAVVVRPGVTVTANAQFFLRPIGTTPRISYDIRVADPSGSRDGVLYSLRNVPPGRYAISLDDIGGTAISDVRQNGQSIFDNGLVVGTSDPAPLDVVVSRSPGSIRGLVRGPNPAAAQYAWVSVVPSEPHRENLSLYKTIRADAQGRFNITGIVPGEYKIFTFDQVPYFAGSNPGFVSRYEAFGLPITITEGQNPTVDPVVIPLQ